ncbi:MAG: hypothetical protein IMW90_17675 [Thermogemmatispora sp.]|jgi:hypothetical protein|uniref:DUF6585 family protein n=1 Tax=Thermogemmatispora sp. TaxID=1968838 RepID=UPI001A09AC15|nr:DUF6585 family protein [Thermogemmatispora sp.]MBE3567547.1 hypothetical protein [Thermogemmatispora sp.]
MATTQVDIPDEIRLLALSTGLGQPVAGLRHEQTSYFRFGFVWLIFISCIESVATAVILYTGVNAISHDDTRIAIAALLVGVLLGAGAVGLVRTIVWHWRKAREIATERYYIFRDGLIIGRAGSCEVIPWREVEAVYQQITRIYVNAIPTGTWAHTRIHCIDGRKVVLRNRTRTAQLVSEMISRGVAEKKFPGALSALNSGQTLDFGPVALRIDGLLRKGRSKSPNTLLPWREVARVEVVSSDQPEIRIYRVGERQRPWRLRPFAIPNYGLFMALLEHLARVN